MHQFRFFVQNLFVSNITFFSVGFLFSFLGEMILGLLNFWFLKDSSSLMKHLILIERDSGLVAENKL